MAVGRELGWNGSESCYWSGGKASSFESEVLPRLCPCPDEEQRERVVKNDGKDSRFVPSELCVLFLQFVGSS